MVRVLCCSIVILGTYPAWADAVDQAAEAETAWRAALEVRVMDKWEALIRNDFTAAHAMTSPAYRELFTSRAFMRRFGNQVGWRRAEIRDVVFKSENAALVGINLDFVYHRTQAEEDLDMTTYVQEPWVRTNGQWWYLVLVKE